MAHPINLVPISTLTYFDARGMESTPISGDDLKVAVGKGADYWNASYSPLWSQPGVMHYDFPHKFYMRTQEILNK